MHSKKLKIKDAAYTVISQKRIPEQIIEKAKKAKECPHCGKTQYELVFTKPTIFVEKTEIGEHRLTTNYNSEKDSLKSLMMTYLY